MHTHTAHVRAFAPGKLFLFGEYAVLGCGWSVVTATGRGVSATVDPEGEAYTTTGTTHTQDTRLPEAVLAALPDAARAPLAHLRTDITRLYHQDDKLGLGSSAASTVALTTALLGPDATAAQRWDVAFRAHRALQGGRGSGADVAASTFGGLLAYRLHEPQPPFTRLGNTCLAASATPHAALITNLTWPEALRVEPIWTRAPASSVRLITLVERALQSTPRTLRAILQEIDAVATAAVDWLCAEAPSVEAGLSLFREGDALMRALGAACHAPIITTAHDALVQHAATHGLVAKPSGAGGGDFSLIAGPQDADWDALLAALPPQCVHIPMTLHVPGAAVKPSDDTKDHAIDMEI